MSKRLARLLEPHAPAVVDATHDLVRFVEEVVDTARKRVEDDCVWFDLGGPLCRVEPRRDGVHFAIEDGGDPVVVRAFTDLDHEAAVLRLNAAQRRLE